MSNYFSITFPRIIGIEAEERTRIIPRTNQMERNKRRKRRGKKWKRIGKRRRRDRQLTARSNFSDLSRPRPRRVIQLRQPSWKGRGNTHRVRAPRPSIDPPTLSISRIPRPRFSITPVFQPLSRHSRPIRNIVESAILAQASPLRDLSAPRRSPA